MAKRFEETDGKLVFRLLKALRAGSESGGDKRGQRSAAITVVNKNDFFLKLRLTKAQTRLKSLRTLSRSTYIPRKSKGELLKDEEG